MPKREKKAGKFDRPGGRALERLRQFEIERGLGPSAAEREAAAPAKSKKGTARRKHRPGT